ncbi:DMT family transporter [Halothermothrix orenii]|uniref:Permease of the drug/metabolite transporter (DMT) superfamily n=1 Tax=Halothermothrix orenii (strain H 168 / OCM 544 / DSM 9562) TaxID=373903 RepID=B8CWX5_HALOH|nr:DMT family transporter [Halothermothrix orenii]ACL69794.1 permease of the drug/metabolite transporter (DMT) superfamily [Halothermothrix orenii H 168]
MKKNLEYFYVLFLIPFLWGSTFLFTKVCLRFFPPVFLGGLRYLTGGLIFAIILILKYGYSHTITTIKRNFAGIVLVGFTGVTIAVLFQNLGLMYTTASSAALLNSFEPVMVFFLSILILKEKATLNKILGLIIGFLGVIIIISNGNLSSLFSLNTNLLGNLLMLVSLLGYSFYTIIGKIVLNDTPPLIVVGVSTLFGGITLLIPSFFLEQIPDLTLTPPEVWFSFIYMATLPTCLAYYLYFKLLQNINASKTVGIILMIPLYGSGLGILILKEPVNPWFVLGSILVLTGAWLTESGKKILNYVRNIRKYFEPAQVE